MLEYRFHHGVDLGGFRILELLRFELTPFQMNSYILKDGGEAIVVDPGEAAPELLAALENVRVKMVVNTHCHIDHVGGNAAVVTASGAPLACHKGDLTLLHALAEQGMMFGVSAPASPEPDVFLEEGNVIEVGSITLEVRHTPGHSPGHIVLVADGFALVGDVLFAGSIGRTDLPGGSHRQLLASIRDKLLGLPDHTRIYSGHGPETTIGQERANNPFLQDL